MTKEYIKAFWETVWDFFKPVLKWTFIFLIIITILDMLIVASPEYIRAGSVEMMLWQGILKKFGALEVFWSILVSFYLFVYFLICLAKARIYADGFYS